MIATTLDGRTASEWADREFERACRLLRAGVLSQAELEEAADRVESLARRTADETARIEIEATAEVLLQLPACLRDGAFLGLPRTGRELDREPRCLSAGPGRKVEQWAPGLSAPGPPGPPTVGVAAQDQATNPA